MKVFVDVEPLHLQNLKLHRDEKKNVADEPSHL
jgi:hypothetical protein